MLTWTAVFYLTFFEKNQKNNQNETLCYHEKNAKNNLMKDAPPHINNQKTIKKKGMSNMEYFRNHSCSANLCSLFPERIRFIGLSNEAPLNSDMSFSQITINRAMTQRDQTIKVSKYERAIALIQPTCGQKHLAVITTRS